MNPDGLFLQQRLRLQVHAVAPAEADHVIALPARLAVVNAGTHVAAARLGRGLIQLPRYRVGRDLADGTLAQVLPDHLPRPAPVSLLYPHSRQLSQRVRVFVDWPARAFA